MKRSSKRFVSVMIVLAFVAAGGWAVWKYRLGKSVAPVGPVDDSKVAVMQPVVSPAPAPAPSKPVPPPAMPATQPATAPAPSAVPPDINESFSRGMTLMQAGKLLEARADLSRALLSGRLETQQEEQAVRSLGDLADRTIFGPEMIEGDPYTFLYTFKSGEVLARVERSLKLHVPPQMMLKINGLREANDIRAGQSLKLINGPFHAIVYKSKFRMDLFLQRDDQPPVFVKRLTVGLGRDGSTPVGQWRVAFGKKLHHAPWNPPPSSTFHGAIQWGEPNYPLGTEGYWISLEGMDDATRRFDGYGIHGTNDPASIGKAASLGCVRLSDPDIDFVYSLLYEKWSTVEVRP